MADRIPHQWPPEPLEPPPELGVLWELVKDARRLRCGVLVHPLGLELRLEMSGQLLYSQVFRNQEYPDLIETSRARRAEAEAKGWTVPGSV